MKTELISRMEELLLKDAGEVAAEVRTLQKEYQKNWTAEFEAARQAFVAEGGAVQDFDFPKKEDDLRFEALVEKYNQLKKESDARQLAEQSRNLLIRQEIIAKIRDLSQVSENVGAAMRKLQELQTQWKETGPVSSHKYKEIQAEYSKALEDIYYNLKIFRDLQEHDLKKNFEMKSELIVKLKALQSSDNIKEAERLIKVYRNEWDEIGPVPNHKWEALKQEYKAALDECYARIKVFYKGVEEQKENSLKSRQDIINRAREIVESMAEAKAARWNDATEKLIALQTEWKSSGKTSEKDNEKTWGEFRAICDKFFEQKKSFFSGLSEKFAENRKIKMDLISRAEALQNSDNWQKTGNELMKLQDEWKKHPSGGDKEEPRLFQRFRKACNTFFDARKKHFDDIESSYSGNLRIKEEILSRLEAFSIPPESNAAREALRGFTEEWAKAGLVPSKDKKRINDAFYAKLDELYDQLNIDRAEKAMMQFSSKIERLAASENAGELLRREADHLRKSIEEINARVRTYDNNLGFFKTSKGSEGFMKEIEDKIAAEKSKIAELTAKRKFVNEQIGKLREPSKANA